MFKRIQEKKWQLRSLNNSKNYKNRKQNKLEIKSRGEQLKIISERNSLPNKKKRSPRTSKIPTNKGTRSFSKRKIRKPFRRALKTSLRSKWTNTSQPLKMKGVLRNKRGRKLAHFWRDPTWRKSLTPMTNNYRSCLNSTQLKTPIRTSYLTTRNGWWILLIIKSWSDSVTNKTSLLVSLLQTTWFTFTRHS